MKKVIISQLFLQILKQERKEDLILLQKLQMNYTYTLLVFQVFVEKCISHQNLKKMVANIHSSF